jgi:hypothetical protein
VCGIHKLIKAEFVEEPVGLLSVTVKDGQLLSLEGFLVPSDRVQVLWELWWRSQRWYGRAWSSIWSLSWFRVQ